LVHAGLVLVDLDAGLFIHLGLRLSLGDGDNIEVSGQTRNLLKDADLVFLQLNFWQGSW
jgi:hypothetical protein